MPVLSPYTGHIQADLFKEEEEEEQQKEKEEEEEEKEEEEEEEQQQEKEEEEEEEKEEEEGKKSLYQNQYYHKSEWYDDFLVWDPQKFNNITKLRIPCHKIWLPDMVLYNNAAEYTDGLMPANAMLAPDGNVFWPVPTKLQSSCKVDVTYFPFDSQECSLKFGSWTYDGYQVDITNRTAEVDLSNYIVNGEWELIYIKCVRNVVRYACCDEPFPDVTFYIKIRRRTLYYMYNVVFPCVMMSALTLLVFCLPPDSGEKIALGITVLLAFSVFMLAVAENLPETSEFVPLISIYLTIVMCLTSVSVIMTVFVLNLHHRGPTKQPVPIWLRRLFLGYDKESCGKKGLASQKCFRKSAGDGWNASSVLRLFSGGPPGADSQYILNNLALKLALEHLALELKENLNLDNGGIIPEVSIGGSGSGAGESELTAVTTTSSSPPSVRTEQQVLDSSITSTPSRQADSISKDVGDDNQTDPLMSTNGKGSASTSFCGNSITHRDPVHQNHHCSQVQDLQQNQPSQRTPLLAYSSSPGGGASSQHGRKRKTKSKQNYEDALQSLSKLLETHEAEERAFQESQDWRRLAQIVDRILFFLFLFATVSSTLAVLVVVPGMQDS
ncbi:neuronal acetylcholine receptor subunit alpha-2 [Elysia marginata]|uniref:Neuronal acetylcholine receptor subunit alpha-2 n=1 Tax=Elysia marginata TaxID=1093978 RepID=A0AAV4JEH7_9GAST|nr:neuronal acetylcholine receptor subunit alpha-2 [Elysia marginata]